jgi:glycosyltransferase involved in cell wall biosynthesis
MTSVALDASAAPQQTGRLPVTVIVPAYNAVATLPRALESVFAQTCPPAEIILIDDASTDATWEVVRLLCAEHSARPIRTVRLTENEGAASARNAGWELATQDFIAFLDADDAWHPRKLEIQHRWLADNLHVMLCGHCCVVKNELAPVPDLPSGRTPVRVFGVASFLIANRLSTPSVMLRRGVRQRFANGKRYSEDFLLWVQIVAANGPAAFIDLPLAFLFKARYGARGLSAELWRMRQGEIDSLARLRQQRIIGRTAWLIASALAWMKFLKRVVVHFSLSLSPWVARNR